MSTAKVISLPVHRTKIVEVGGQVVYLRRYHCAFCQTNYHGKRCHKIRFWEEARDIKTGKLEYTLNTLSICATSPETKTTGEIKGCFEVGIHHLLTRVKKGRVAGALGIGATRATGTTAKKRKAARG